MHKFLVKYFSVTKWQGIAILVLMIAILALAVLSYCLPYLVSNKLSTLEKNSIDSLASNIIADTSHGGFNYQNNSEFNSNAANIKPFNFDPNTLSEDGFKKLGLLPKTIAIILNYRNKNGKFYSKADVQKMYSLSTEEYKILEPYIDLPVNNKMKQVHLNNFIKKKYVPITVEINTADTAMFNKLRGIGTVLSQRIVAYRNSIGGFYSISQLKEVYGVTDSTFEKIKNQLQIDKHKINLININTVSFQTLSVHPFFKNGEALAILKYRKLHNDKIANWEEIKNLPEIKPDIAEKIKNYLTY